MLNQRTILPYTRSFGRLARQAAVCTAVVALTACGGGDGSGSDMTITPEQPDTIEDVTRSSTLGTPHPGTLGVGDIDFFRFEPTQPGTLEIDLSNGSIAQAGYEVTGRDSDGMMVELPRGMGGEVIITAELIARGVEVFVRVSASSGTGSGGTGRYVLEVTLTPNDGTTASSTLPTL